MPIYNIPVKKINLILSLLFFSVAIGYTQKLPNVQSVSRLLPTKVSIDGKLMEWQDVLTAYNKATRMEYVLANDADNLYLAIRSKDVGTTAKILAGGVTLNINTSGKKVATGPSITYPLTSSDYTVSPTGSVEANFSVLKDSLAITKAIKEFKLIKVNNLYGVQDSVLSIYNEVSIKTQTGYNNGTLVCEIMIPKKLLGLVDLSIPFTYQIKLGGVVVPSLPGVPPPPPTAPNPNRAPTSNANIMAEIREPTYLWGEYTLAK